MNSHTPTPWEICNPEDKSVPEIWILGALEKLAEDDEPGQKMIVRVETTPEMKANADFLLRAVNAHEIYEKTLRLIAERDKGQAGIEAREAIAKVEQYSS